MLFVHQVGIAYAQKGFKVDEDTSFQTEPLKTAFSERVLKKGVFIAVRTKLSDTCKSKLCKFALALLGKGEKGKDSFLFFTANGNEKGLEFTAAVHDRKITEKIRFSKIEIYMKVWFAVS